jgi:hypothetical protein
MSVCVCVCVCVRESENEGITKKWQVISGLKKEECFRETGGGWSLLCLSTNYNITGYENRSDK